MGMYDRIALRCKELGITPGYLCDSVGLRRAYMSELKNGRTKNLSCEKVAILAKALKVSCDFLITGEDSNSEYSKDEVRLISAYRMCSDEEKENINFMLRKYYDAYGSVDAADAKDAV